MNNLRRIAFIAAMGFAAPAGAQDSPNPVALPDAAPPVSAEVPKQSIQERLTFLLSGYEYFPTRPDLDAVAPSGEVASTLRAFASDAAARPSLRLRAVDALGYYDDAETIALLQTLVIQEPKVDLPRRELRTAGLLRHHAITALARSQGEAAVEILQSVFATNDVQLTLTAIHAIGKHCGKAGNRVLAKLQDETENKTIGRELAKWVQ